MVALNKICRNANKKVDLQLALRDAILKQQHGPDEVQRREIFGLTGTTDASLVDRILGLGFTSESIGALRYAPIAEVAWASGQVTERELVLAVNPVFSPEMLSEPQAVEMFRAWLADRPSVDLWTVWEDYTRQCVNRCETSEAIQFGQQLYNLAVRIAEASGGLLNQGDICAAERIVLNKIAQVYSLQPASV